MGEIKSVAELAAHMVGASAVLWQTRSGGPIRTIVTGTRTVPTGRYMSYKNNRHMPWESTFEERLMEGCEGHPDVTAFTSQPHMLEIFERGGNLIYYPDLRVDFCDGSVEIIEVASKKDKRKDRSKYMEKIRRARSVYEDLLGWTYRELQGETIAADPAFSNLVLVQRYRRTLTSIADEGTIAELSRRGDPFPYGPACEVLGGYPQGKAKLHAMMVQGIVSIELYRGAITVDTPVTYASARRRHRSGHGSVHPLPGKERARSR